jgi:pimeloyl-ACP methyl ester carboxylesterase
MSAEPTGAAPIGTAPHAAQQITGAVRHLRQAHAIQAIHLVAHSWGTIPASLFAATHPGVLASLTLFGPVVDRDSTAPLPAAVSWWSLPACERLRQLRYEDLLPARLRLLEAGVEERWAEAFEHSAPRLGADPPGTIRIPAGPMHDWPTVARGQYPYQATKVDVPVMVVYGDYDDVVDDASAVRFLGRFSESPRTWNVRVGSGTHVMHLERERHSLYESVEAFHRVTTHPAGTSWP